VELASAAGVSKLVLETDCAGAVAKLKNAEMDRSIHGPMMEEIKEMLHQLCYELVVCGHGGLLKGSRIISKKKNPVGIWEISIVRNQIIIRAT
jgi:hypothetical protein